MDNVTVTLTRAEAQMVVRALYVLDAVMFDRKIPVRITRTEAARRDASYARKKVALALNGLPV